MRAGHDPRAPALGPRERELILEGARLEPEDGRLERAIGPGEAIDWDAVVFHGHLHSVAPLLQFQLRRLPGYRDLPATARRRLIQLTHRADYQNRHFAREQGAIVTAFRAEGIETMVPKGLPLVEHVYGGNARRPLIDLIFVVRPARFADAVRTLAEAGYRRKPMHPLHAAWRWCCPIATMTAFRGISVATLVFTRPINWPRVHSLDPSGIWERARTVTVAGEPVLMPAPEDLVIYLCVQADNHGYLNRAAVGSLEAEELLFTDWANNRLVRFADLRETIRHLGPRLDWDVLADRAAASGLGETVRTSLELTESLLGPVVPAEALDRVGAEPGRHRLRGWLLESIRAAEAERRTARSSAGAWWLRLGPRRQSRLAPLLSLAEYAFPDPGLLGDRRRGGPRAALSAAYVSRSAAVVARSILAIAQLVAAGVARRLREALGGRRGERSDPLRA